MAEASKPRFVVVGNPENRRLTLFQAALKRQGLGAAFIISWLDVIAGTADLESWLTSETIWRIDSAGEDFTVERQLIALGAEENAGSKASQISAATARNLAFDRGRINYPSQYFLGFATCLRRLQKIFEENDAVMLMNHPEEIITMFDKPRCHRLLEEAGVAVPRSLGPVHSHEQLREQMRARGVNRVFVKLAYSSSASGVVAYETNWRREQAWTSVELADVGGETRLYNSLKVRRYKAAREIAEIIDRLCAEGVQVEEWIPKAGFDGGVTDFRVLVVDGQPAHRVLRLGVTPLTNLHLGNRRGDLSSFFHRAGEAAEQTILRVCAQTAAQFPRSLYAGIDIGLTPDFKSAFVFEVNAFGDLLPNLTFQGADTYEYEINAALSRRRRGEKEKGRKGEEET